MNNPLHGEERNYKKASSKWPISVSELQKGDGFVGILEVA